jgi:hypothetical protein
MASSAFPEPISGIKESLLDATGDILYASADNTPARLGIGTTGQVLNVASGVPAWATASSGLSAATQAEMETASSTSVATTPGRQQFHPSAAKFWLKFNGTGTPAINASYNITSITDGGTGYYTINIATDFSSGDYAICTTIQKLSGASSSSTILVASTVPPQNGGDFGLVVFTIGGSGADPDAAHCIGFGDQA